MPIKGLRKIKFWTASRKNDSPHLILVDGYSDGSLYYYMEKKFGCCWHAVMPCCGISLAKAKTLQKAVTLGRGALETLVLSESNKARVEEFTELVENAKLARLNGDPKTEIPITLQEKGDQVMPKYGDPCILLNGMAYTKEELSKALGIQINTVALSVDVPSGHLTASGGDPDYPGIEIELNMEGCAPRRIAMVEQEVDPDDDKVINAPKAFLYGTEESYIAYTEVDARTDRELADNPRVRDRIVCGGDIDKMLEVCLENQHTGVIHLY